MGFKKKSEEKKPGQDRHSPANCGCLYHRQLRRQAALEEMDKQTELPVGMKRRKRRKPR